MESEQQRKNKTKKLALLGLFLALALILSYVEILLPMNFGIPGIKLGLANAVVLLALYLVGTKAAFLLSVSRIALSALLFGTLFSFLYSLLGGLLSFLVMVLLKKTKKLHIVTVSVFGGISHNLGQLIVAYFFVSNVNLFYYLPVLLLAGALTGAVIGVISAELMRRLNGFFRREL